MNQGGNKDALLKSYSTRLRDDVKSMLENFEETVKLAKGENETQLSKLTQCEQGDIIIHSMIHLIYLMMYF